MNAIKESKKLIRKAIRNMPDLPFVTKRQQSMMPYILGAIGVAVFGAVAAVMVFSPRTRYRALGAAKDAYGKVQGRLEGMGIANGMNHASTQGNNVGHEYSATNGL